MTEYILEKYKTDRCMEMAYVIIVKMAVYMKEHINRIRRMGMVLKYIIMGICIMGSLLMVGNVDMADFIGLWLINRNRDKIIISAYSGIKGNGGVDYQTAKANTTKQTVIYIKAHSKTD